jgi:chemotaxis methyl-accepting protein methylase
MVFMKGMDIIFCCNVPIYFDTNSKRMVIQHFYNNLSSHGYLFPGALGISLWNQRRLSSRAHAFCHGLR